MRGRNSQSLTHDHSDLGDLLKELREALEAQDVARSHAALDLFWARLAVHIRAEHLHLFPSVLEALSSPAKSNLQTVPSLDEARNIVEALRRDHDFFMHELSRAMISIRELLSASDREDCADQLRDVGATIAAIETRLANHNRIEENGIYLWPTILLSEIEQAKLAGRVLNELAKMPPRFAADMNPTNKD